jgi:hypothetical protein
MDPLNQNTNKQINKKKTTEMPAFLTLVALPM